MAKKMKLTKDLYCPKCKAIVTCKGLSGEEKILICPNCGIKGFYKFPELSNKDEDFQIKSKIMNKVSYFIVIFVIIMAYYFFNYEDIIGSFLFLALIPIFGYFNYDVRIPFLYAIIILSISASTLAFINNVNLANQFATYSYWLIFVGIVCQLIEFLKKQWDFIGKKQSA